MLEKYRSQAELDNLKQELLIDRKHIRSGGIHIGAENGLQNINELNTTPNSRVFSHQLAEIVVVATNDDLVTSFILAFASVGVYPISVLFSHFGN